MSIPPYQKYPYAHPSSKEELFDLIIKRATGNLDNVQKLVQMDYLDLRSDLKLTNHEYSLLEWGNSLGDDTAIDIPYKYNLTDYLAISRLGGVYLTPYKYFKITPVLLNHFPIQEYHKLLEGMATKLSNTINDLSQENNHPVGGYIYIPDRYDKEFHALIKQIVDSRNTTLDDHKWSFKLIKEEGLKGVLVYTLTLTPIY